MVCEAVSEGESWRGDAKGSSSTEIIESRDTPEQMMTDPAISSIGTAL